MVRQELKKTGSLRLRSGQAFDSAEERFAPDEHKSRSSEISRLATIASWQVSGNPDPRAKFILAVTRAASGAAQDDFSFLMASLNHSDLGAALRETPNRSLYTESRRGRRSLSCLF